MKMDERFKLIYTGYLGKEMQNRLPAIIDFVTKFNGRAFFDKYSTYKDSILDFLKRCDAEGIDL